MVKTPSSNTLETLETAEIYQIGKRNSGIRKVENADIKVVDMHHSIEFHKH